MPGYGDLAENAILNVTLRGVVYPYSAGVFMGLHSADPGDTGIFELAGLSYARQPCLWAAPVGGVCTLVNDVNFSGLPAATVAFYSIWNAAGVYVGSGTLPSQPINNGDAITVVAGTTFTLT